MKSTKKYTNFDEVARDINALYDAVNKPQQSVGSGSEGKSGDLRLTFDDGGYAYIEGKGNEGWLTSFTGVLVDKPSRGRPTPHFPFLEVDNLLAKIFTVNQLTSSNGNSIMSDYGIVERFDQTNIWFKDQTNLGLCAFAVGDTCEVRSIKADKSLDIKKINFTVTAVDRNKVTVTYSAAVTVAVGDVVVRLGNTTTAARQNAIYFSTSDTNSPYIDLYSGTTLYTFGSPIVRFGNLTGDGALTGFGLHIGAGGKIVIDPAATVTGFDLFTVITSYSESTPTSPKTGDIWYKPSTKKVYRYNGATWDDITPRQTETFYGTSTPTTMLTGDIWYDTNTGVVKLKRYNGATWDEIGKTGTYIDSTGLYTGTVVAQNIIAGTGLVANLSVLSTLTMGSAGVDGYIQSYGWNGTVNGYQLKGGATPTFNSIGATITGGTIQTAPSGNTRLKFSGSTLDFYHASTGSGLTVVGSFTPVFGSPYGVGYTGGLNCDALYAGGNEVATQTWVTNTATAHAASTVTNGVYTNTNNTLTGNNIFQKEINFDAEHYQAITADVTIDITNYNALVLNPDTNGWAVTISSPTSGQIIYVQNYTPGGGAPYTVIVNGKTIAGGGAKLFRYSTSYGWSATN